MTEYELAPDRRTAVERWTAEGFSTEQIAELCIASGWNPLETIKMLKTHFGVAIGQGKAMVDHSQGPEAATANSYLRYQADLVSRFPPEATEEDAQRMASSTGWDIKLWALVRAERFDDIRAALDRFDPKAMTFPEMSLDEAQDLVEAELSRWDLEMEVMEEHTVEYPFGWTFACQTSTFKESRNFLDMAVGHGPMLVDKYTGVMWITGSALSPVCVSNYQSTGDPSRSAA